MKNCNVRVPTITSLETAIRLYYERIELSNTDIKELFGSLSPATITKLKKVVQTVMIERGTPVWDSHKVNTEVAYECWGLGIEDLERRYEKIKMLA